MPRTAFGSAEYARPSTPSAPAARSGGGEADGRVRRSRERVLTTAFELLSESGVGGFTIEEVARRSGVAKTTIYRHWPTRAALVIEACSRITSEQQVPDTGSLEGDVAAILADIAHLLGTARWASVLPSIIDAAERDPAFAEVHRGIQHGHAAPLREVLQRAVDRGELPPAANLSSMIAGLLGPLFYRRWFSREPLDDQFLTIVAAIVLGGQGPTDEPLPA